jgi:hypothetical protein
MHALSATPYRPRRGLGAIARQVAVDLTPQAIEQVASRVAQLLHRQEQRQQNDEARQELGMLTVAQLAQHLHLNRAWVYQHADELGAIRIGSGPKARIRFDLHTTTQALRQHQPGKTQGPATPKPRKPRRSPASPYRTDAPLLEIRDPYARGVRARFVTAPRRGGIGVI